MDDDQLELSALQTAKIEYKNSISHITDIVTLAKMMKALQAEKDEADAKASLINARYDVLRLEVIPQRCEEQGIDGMKVGGVGRLGLTPDLYVSVKRGEKDGLFSWLKKRKLSDLIQPSVNSSTLKAFVKTRMKEGKEVPSEYLNVTPFTRATITKA